MTKIRRGGYVFVTWVGDHAPRHVHVYRDDKLLARWNLEAGVPITGRVPAIVSKLLRELVAEGRL